MDKILIKTVKIKCPLNKELANVTIEINEIKDSTEICKTHKFLKCKKKCDLNLKCDFECEEIIRGVIKQNIKNITTK